MTLRKEHQEAAQRPSLDLRPEDIFHHIPKESLRQSYRDGRRERLYREYHEIRLLLTSGGSRTAKSHA